MPLNGTIAITGTNMNRVMAVLRNDKRTKDKQFVKIVKNYILDVLLNEERSKDAVGINWATLNNQNMVKYLGYKSNEMENFSDMLTVENDNIRGAAWVKEMLDFVFNGNMLNCRETRRFKKAISNKTLIDDKAVTMLFANNKECHPYLKKIIEKTIPDSAVYIINGDYITNKEAEEGTKKFMKENEGKRIFIISALMGCRSYSIPEIKNIVLLIDGGSSATTTQRVGRGLTPWNNDHKICHVIDFRVNEYEGNPPVYQYLEEMAMSMIDDESKKRKMAAIKELIKEASEKLTFNEYFAKNESGFKELSADEVYMMMDTPHVAQYKFETTCEPVLDGLGKTESINKLIDNLSGNDGEIFTDEMLRTQNGIENENEKGDKDRFMKVTKKSLNKCKKYDEETREELSRKAEIYRCFQWISNNINVFNTYDYKKNIFELTMKNDVLPALSEETKGNAFDASYGLKQGTHKLIVEVIKGILENVHDLGDFDKLFFTV